MTKLALALAVLLMAAPLIAQDHPVSHKKVSDEITISTDVKIAGNFLKAGKYKIECDHVRIVFTNVDSGQKVDLPCEGPELGAKKPVTEVYIATADDGSRYINKLYLRGSPIEHVFKN
jgi:hypothetical protein